MKTPPYVVTLVSALAIAGGVVRIVRDGVRAAKRDHGGLHILV